MIWRRIDAYHIVKYVALRTTPCIGNSIDCSHSSGSLVAPRSLVFLTTYHILLVKLEEPETKQKCGYVRVSGRASHRYKCASCLVAGTKRRHRIGRYCLVLPRVACCYLLSLICRHTTKCKLLQAKKCMYVNTYMYSVYTTHLTRPSL